MLIKAHNMSKQPLKIYLLMQNKTSLPQSKLPMPCTKWQLVQKNKQQVLIRMPFQLKKLLKALLKWQTVPCRFLTYLVMLSNWQKKVDNLSNKRYSK
ncbi:hypothetical protein D9M73_207950 [compost metagenome]